jgi:uncharacterized membrane protein YbhN (UPF0104 family)
MPTEPAGSESRDRLLMMRRKYIAIAIKTILTVIILCFLGRQVQQHWADIREHNWDINLWYSILSVICAQIALFLFTPMWQNQIGSFGYKVTLAESNKVLYLSSLRRYIPDKI